MRQGSKKIKGPGKCPRKGSYPEKTLTREPRTPKSRAL